MDELMIDRKTMTELSLALNELSDYVKWLQLRRDTEHVRKLLPIARRIIYPLTAVVFDNVPEIDPILEIYNAYTAFNSRLNKATAEKEIAQLISELDAFEIIVAKKLAEFEKRGTEKRKLNS